MRRKLIFLLAAMVMLVSGFTSTASAHYDGLGDAVSNEWMNYKDNSKYNVHAAANLWDPLNCRWSYNGVSCPGVDLDEYGVDAGTVGHPVTLVVSDVNIYKGAWSGMTSNPTPGPPDYIYLNKYYMDNKSAFSQKLNIAHELGHGLGFDHPPSTTWYLKNSIMVPFNFKGDGIESHDYSDYYNVWLKLHY